MDIEKIKLANKIYETMADKTKDEAINHLRTFENLDQEVFKLVKGLITNSQHSDTYFAQKVSQYYQPSLSPSLGVNDCIGNYELLELIGEGGMSLVYKAQRVNSNTQKPVAIKIFNLPNLSPKIKTRFQAEQDILSELSHPNIIEFHHGEHTDNGDSYIVMELVDGGLAIDDYVKKKQLKPKQIIALIIQAAEALQYAHQQLIIHRDIKPSNLIVTANDQLKILDFGIAKLIRPDADDTKALNTDHTLVALTPSFAAPEQIKIERIDVTTDVFSLAAVAVFLLSGEQPFPANRMLTACADDDTHLRKLLKSKLKDRDLRHILTQALQSNNQARYPNMFAFKEDLYAWQAQKPVSASGDSWWYRLSRLAHRRTALFSTSVVLVLTVLVAFVILSLQNQAIKHEIEKAQAVKQFMLDSFSVTDPNVSQGVDLSTKDLLRLAAEKINNNDGMDSTLKHELYISLALAHGRLGYYSEAINLLNDALKIKPKNEQSIALLAQYLFSAGHIETLNQLLSKTQEQHFSSTVHQAAVIRVRSNVLAQSGEYQEAFNQFEKLKTIQTVDEDILRNQSLLAEIYYLKGESNRSIAIIEQLKKDHPLPATDVFNMGLNSDLVLYYDRVSNFAAAMELTQQNIQAFRKILGDQHPELGMAYNSLSVFQRLNGQFSEALASAKTSEQIFRTRYGDNSEGLAQALSNEGVTYYYQKQADKAIEKLTEAADMLTTIFGADHPETMNAKANLATILNASGFPKKALPILQHMYQVETKTLGKAHRSALYTQQALALTLANLGQFENATNHASENIILATEHLPNHVQLINHAHSILGRVYFMSGKHQLALEQNLHHIEHWTQGNENSYAETLSQIANSYQALNLFDQASNYYQLWIVQLEKIYGETDDKYLDSLLDWAESAQQMQQVKQAEILINQVQKIISENDLKLNDIQTKLDQLRKNM